MMIPEGIHRMSPWTADTRRWLACTSSGRSGCKPAGIASLAKIISNYWIEDCVID